MAYLQSLTIPSGSDTTTYHVPQIFTSLIEPYAGGRVFALFGPEDNNFTGIIYITLDNDTWSIFYSRPLNIIKVISSTNSNINLLYGCNNNANAYFALNQDGAKLSCAINNVYDVKNSTDIIDQIISNFTTIALQAPVTIYQGTTLPSFAQPGDLYIQIEDTTNENN